MDFLRFVFTKVFLKNLVIAGIIASFIILGSFWGLNIYTKHGEAYPVPNFRYSSLDSVEFICQENNLRYSIYDSVFVNGLPGGMVIDQFPDSGFMVKQNRNIYLTVNMYEAQKIPMPNLVDLSFRKAQSILEGSGLNLGKIIIEPSRFKNLILKQIHDSIEIIPNELISKGSTIDLVLGRGPSTEKTLIPYLVSLSLDSAKKITSDAYLNLGAIIFDETILDAEDSINARIFEQKPEANKISTIMLGSAIDIWLTNNETKIELDTIFFNLNDSLNILNDDSIN